MTVRRSPYRLLALLAAALVALTALASCGDDEVETSSGADATGDPVAEHAADDEALPVGSGAAAGTCPVGTIDCVDTPLDGDAPVSGPAADGGDPGVAGGDEFPSEQAREDARALLGLAEAELPADVRVGRRGAEQMMLIEDYVLGRITVELDDDGSGTYVVSQATVELPDGPETFTADRD